MKTESIIGLKQEITIRMTAEKTYVLEGEKKPEQLNPKELLLLAGATCAGMSAMHIMSAERFTPQRFEVTMGGVLNTETLRSDSVFTSFHIRYRVEGTKSRNDMTKADRAIRLSHEKYCGAVKMFGKIANIEETIEIK